ncbi:hypothetical protein FGO68_gene5030 [Halteria grandinella]|uniref:Right handed beta helix domain-containing protein n=1 Tax=Halteria grandinella TaxID=5974 RepID=A0A8J8P9X2_HALGN|nr:hypothetical protein FGO68_gene5030 [Halteria grandinella]
MPLVNKYLTTSLIFCHTMISLTLGPSNKFKNIWLIDYRSALSRQQEQGILLYLQNFKGELKIGNENGESTVEGITGMLNPFTQERFFKWNPRDLLVDVKSEVYQENLIYGAGSILFHIHSPTNQFTSVKLEGLHLSDIYHRPQKSSSFDLNLPSILSTILNRTDPSLNRVPLLNISSVSIEDAQYENSTGFFELQAEVISLNGIRMKNIGERNMLSQPEWKEWEIIKPDSSELVAESPIFTIVMLNQESPMIGTSFELRNSAFDQIDGGRGALPLVQIEISKDSGNRMNFSMTDINLSNCVAKNENQLPSASLFQIVSTNKHTQNNFLRGHSKRLNLTIQLEDIQVSQTSTQFGLFVLEREVDSVTVSASTFRYNKGVEATILAIKDQIASSITFSQCKFLDHQEQINVDQILRLYYTKNRTDQFNKPSMFKVDNMRNLTFDMCSAGNYYFASYAAFLQMYQNSEVMILDSIIQDMSASFAGAILVQKESKLRIEGTSFSGISSFDSGVFQVLDRSYIEVIDSKFTSNAAILNGVFKVASQSWFLIDHTTFSKNKAELRNSIGQLNQIGQDSSFIDCDFEYNVATISPIDTVTKYGGGIEIFQSLCNLLFAKCTFHENQSRAGSTCLTIVASDNVVIIQSIFKITQKITEITGLKNGAFISIFPRSGVGIGGSKFTGGQAYFGGAIYSQGLNQINVFQCEFYENVAKIGGAIYGDNVYMIDVINSVFDQNIAVIQSETSVRYGDAMYFQGTINGFVTIFNVTITADFYSNHVAFNEVIVVIIKDSTFRQLPSNETADPMRNSITGVYIKNACFILITNSVFDGNSGGALELEQFDLGNSTYDGLISSCKFYNSKSASNGGAISIKSYFNLTIEDTDFVNNTAERAGGAIYYECTEKLACVLRLNNVLFQGNRAFVEGGAIKWTHYEPLMSNIRFRDNQARIYGNDIASIANELVIIEGILKNEIIGSIYYNRDDQTRNAKQLTYQAKSGGASNIYFGIIDKYGSFIKTDNQSKLLIKVVKQSVASHIVPVIESQTEIISNGGCYIIENFVLIAEPGTTLSKTLNSLKNCSYIILNNRN